MKTNKLNQLSAIELQKMGLLEVQIPQRAGIWVIKKKEKGKIRKIGIKWLIERIIQILVPVISAVLTYLLTAKG